MIVDGGLLSIAGTSGIALKNGTTSMSISTDLINNVTKQSSNNYLSGTGGTDPGGDPSGNPIPVGDGWELFIFLGVCYVTYKRRGYLKDKLTFS